MEMGLLSKDAVHKAIIDNNKKIYECCCKFGVMDDVVAVILEIIDTVPEMKLNTNDNTYELAVQAIEELQAYRELGTVEELKAIKNSTQLILDILNEYSNVGTIEEFKILKSADGRVRG